MQGLGFRDLGFQVEALGFFKVNKLRFNQKVLEFGACYAQSIQGLGQDLHAQT